VGGLTVMGNGSAGSGGTISGKTGTDGDNLTGVGIYLDSCVNIIINNMQLNDFENFGILGFNVHNLTLDSSIVNSSGKNGNNSGLNEGSVSFGNSTPKNGLTGNVTISNCTIEDGYVNNVHLVNHTGTLSQLTVNNTVIQDNSSASPGNDGLRIEASGTATLTADIIGCSFLRNLSNGAVIINSGSGLVDVEFRSTANIFTNNHSGIGLVVSGSNNGDMNFTISNCVISTPALTNSGTPISCALGSTTTIGTLMSGYISNNTLSNNNSTLATPGIDVLTQGSGECRTSITGNLINNIADIGLNMQAAGNSKITSTISSNTITLTDAAATEGILIQSGALSTDLTTVCVKMNANSISTGVSDDILVRNRFAGTIFNIENLPGAPTNNVVNIANYITSQNFLTGTVTATVNGNTFGSCFPALPLNIVQIK
jgi:hypothetical protein